MALKYTTWSNATLPTSLKLTSLRSITKQSLIVWDPANIASMPLHITLGIRGWLINLGVEAIVADRVPAAAAAYEAAIGETLGHDAGVSPAPFWGGSFAGKQWHKIEVSLAALCDRLDAFLSPARDNVHHRACRIWADSILVLNCASPIDASQRTEFRQRAAAFVDRLRADFEWVSITPKLHALACHAADFLGEFGSLGLFAEQGMEAWHGYFNQNAAVFAAPTFLGFVRLVDRAAIGLAPGSKAFNRDNCRATASPEARSAKRVCDLCTNRGREAAGVSSEHSAACEARAAEVGDMQPKIMHAVAVLKIARCNKKSARVSNSGPPPSKDTKNDALLAEAQAMCVAALFDNWHGCTFSLAWWGTARCGKIPNLLFSDRAREYQGEKKLPLRCTVRPSEPAHSWSGNSLGHR